MRFQRIVLLALTVIAIFAVPAAMAAPEDSCQLLTKEQVRAAVGVPVGAGEHVTPTSLKTCTWTASGSKDVSSVTISYWAAQSYEGAKSMAVAMVARAKIDAKAKGAAVDPASGIGDDAFYTTMGEGYTAILVKKGNVSFKVAIYGNMPADKKKSVEKTLALQALSKV